MFVAVCFCVQYSLRKGLSEQWGNNAVPLASSARSRFAALASKKTEFSGASSVPVYQNIFSQTFFYMNACV